MPKGDKSQVHEIVLKQPCHGLQTGDVLARVEVRPGISVNVALDALRAGVARECCLSDDAEDDVAAKKAKAEAAKKAKAEADKKEKAEAAKKAKAEADKKAKAEADKKAKADADKKAEQDGGAK